MVEKGVSSASDKAKFSHGNWGQHSGMSSYLLWFYDGKKNAVVKVFTMWSFFSGFTVLLIIPEIFNLAYN